MEFYYVDIKILTTEHKLFCNFKILQEINNNSPVSDISKLSLVSAETLSMVLTLGKIIQIFGVIPGTSCEAERSFTAPTCLKTYLRSTMTQNRLESLALLHIKREFVNQVLAEDMERMIDNFVEVKGRRQFFIQCNGV